ncbi:hypothetical protein Sjap_002786 [Stephania japonica]|uniref:Uncharacterized protein n=1 Tax=Stephania japonica TaxID=461633 RepID=A0AAP0PWG0_9MAGN
MQREEDEEEEVEGVWGSNLTSRKWRSRLSSLPNVVTPQRLENLVIRLPKGRQSKKEDDGTERRWFGVEEAEPLTGVEDSGDAEVVEIGEEELALNDDRPVREANAVALGCVFGAGAGPLALGVRHWGKNACLND